MKFPWSKKDYEYSKFSAPITNGILRNSKVSAPTAALVRPRDNNVTFRIPRTGSSQLPLNTICDEFKRTEIIDRDRQSVTVSSRGIRSASRPSMSREDSIVIERTRREGRRYVAERTKGEETRVAERRSRKDGKSTTERRVCTSSVASGSSADEKDKQKRVRTRKVEQRGSSSSVASGCSADEKDKQTRVSSRKAERRGSSSSISSGGSHDKDKPKKTPHKVERRGSASSTISGGSISDTDSKRKLSTSITSEVSENSSDTLGSLDNPARLGDLTSDQIESSYGKQGESNGTIDTADVSESSDESLSRPRQQQAQLEMLLDEKIQAKMSRMKAKERTKA